MNNEKSIDELKSQIRYLYEVKGLSFRQIAIDIGVCRNKLSRIYSDNWTPPAIDRGHDLDAQRDLIAHWYHESPTLKAIQIYERLMERGVQAAYTTVVRYTREFRQKRKARIYWPLEFLPGEEAQVDWFFVNHPKLGKLCGFAIILSYSRHLFAHLFPRHSFEFFIEGHLMALKAFGGSPTALRYDNLKSVVLKRQPITYNSTFLDFARYIGFEIRLCNVAAGNEKGRVERVIRTLRGTFFNTANHHQSLKALNADLHEWVNRKNHTIHRTTEAQPVDRWREEKLKPLPDTPWHNVMILPPKIPTKTGLVIFDTNGYSFPDYLGHSPVVVHAGVDRIELYTVDQKCVASHTRCFGRKQQIIHPAHRHVSRLSTAAKRERVMAVIRNMDPMVKRFIDLHATVGEDPYAQAHAFFRMLKHHSRGMLVSAIREAVMSGSPRVSFVQAKLQPVITQHEETVSPYRDDLLDIDYQPRSLEDYDDEN